MGKIIAVITLVLIWAVIPLLSIYGWISNVVKLLHTTNHESVLFIARCVGVVLAPLGSVLGFV